MSERTRECRCCHETKPLDKDHFYRNGSSFRHICATCYQAGNAGRSTAPKRYRGPKTDGPKIDLPATESIQSQFAPLVRQYLAARSFGPGPALSLAHEILADALKVHGGPVTIDGRVWRWSGMADGIVSSPIHRAWQPSTDTMPARGAHRIAWTGLESKAERAALVEMAD